MSKSTSVRLPDFLVLGVPKAGTTSLYEYLREHPDIYLPERKELHYFTVAELRKRTAGPGDRDAVRELPATPEQYRAHFAGVSDEKRVGEVSPSYFYHIDSIAQKLRQELGSGLRVIVVLRNPVTRAVSNYKHQLRLGYESETLARAVALEPQRAASGYGDFWQYSGHSRYADKIQSILDQFPREQVRIVLFEDLVSEPGKTLADLYEFLEVDASFVPDSITRKFNEGGVYKKGAISRYLARPHYTKTWIKNALPDSWAARARKTKDWILRKQIVPMEPPSPSELTALANLFREDVSRLRKLLGRNLDAWTHFNESEG